LRQPLQFIVRALLQSNVRANTCNRRPAAWTARPLYPGRARMQPSTLSPW